MDGSSCLAAAKASTRSSFRVVKTAEEPPHAEGMAQPKDFFAHVATFIPDEQELIHARECPPAHIRLAIPGRLG
jgi:hypothetical protein